MAINVPDAATVADKWAARANVASADYTAGVTNPKKDWATNTAAAQANYQAAVQAGNIGTKFANGVKKAGTAKWQNNAVKLGATRYSGGITNAKPAMAAGIGPYLSVIAGLTLPDRQPRGNPANYQRSAAVGTALNQKRVALQGAGV